MPMKRFNRRSTAEQVTEGLDLTGKRFVITGVNSGLGFESMRVLCSRGAHVVGLARTLQKAVDACNRVAGETTALACELSDFQSVRACCDFVNENFDNIDGIICNAGIMALPELETKNRLELQFLTNHMGHFLLIRLLTDKLKASDEARVVIVSSMGHQLTVPGGIDFDNLDGHLGYDAWKFYGQSKLANLLTARHLAIEFENSSVTVNAVHPGVIHTNLARNAKGFFVRLITFFSKLVERTIPQGAATQCYVATHPDVSAVSGEYFADCKVTKSTLLGESRELAKELCEYSEKLLKPYLGVSENVTPLNLKR